MHKTKDVQGQRPTNVNLSLVVCCFDVCRPSLPFPTIKVQLTLKIFIPLLKYMYIYLVFLLTSAKKLS